MLRLSRSFGAALSVAALMVGCGDEAELRVIRDYTVTVDQGDDSLIIFAEPCESLYVNTSETDSEVRLTVSLLDGGRDREDCIGATSPAVSLTRPLGDRAIVDDPTGDDLTATIIRPWSRAGSSIG